MLTSPYQEGSTVVIVASAGGNDHHPDWYLNILNNAEVTLSFEGEPTQHMKGVTASPSERVRLWQVITKDHRNYAEYQGKTRARDPGGRAHPERKRSVSVSVPTQGIGE